MFASHLLFGLLIFAAVELPVRPSVTVPRGRRDDVRIGDHQYDFDDAVALIQKLLESKDVDDQQRGLRAMGIMKVHLASEAAILDRAKHLATTGKADISKDAIRALHRVAAPRTLPYFVETLGNSKDPFRKLLAADAVFRMIYLYRDQKVVTEVILRKAIRTHLDLLSVRLQKDGDKECVPCGAKGSLKNLAARAGYQMPKYAPLREVKPTEELTADEIRELRNEIMKELEDWWSRHVESIVEFYLPVPEEESGE